MMGVLGGLALLAALVAGLSGWLISWPVGLAAALLMGGMLGATWRLQATLKRLEDLDSERARRASLAADVKAAVRKVNQSAEAA